MSHHETEVSILTKIRHVLPKNDTIFTVQFVPIASNVLMILASRFPSLYSEMGR
jgi:hypothetical protein